jgi:RecB family exonuclease
MDKDSQETQKRKRVSYSQYSLYKKCPTAYKYKYIDKLGVNEKNIALVFGSAMHDTIQSYLHTIYNKKELNENTEVNDIKLQPYLLYEGTKNQRLDTEKLLRDRMYEEVQKIDDQHRSEWITKEEMIEHYMDGVEILKYLEDKRSEWFKLRGMKLESIEYKLQKEIRPGIDFIGYIDLLFVDSSGCYHIIDLKTSKAGWKDYHKKDKTKTNQNLLYKRFFSKLMDVPEDMINVEFLILKRKIPHDAQFASMKKRLQRFIPANGKGSVNNAVDDFMEFVDRVFVDKTETFEANPTKFNCTYCEFYNRGICDKHFFK